MSTWRRAALSVRAHVYNITHILMCIYIRYYYGMRLVGERTRYSLATTQNLCITVHIPSIESADSCSS